MPGEFILTAITADPELVRAADEAGVDRIGIDVERIGKLARQGHLPRARFAAHQLDDLAVVAANVRHAAVFARLNPLHEESAQEIERALQLNAQFLMLPYFARPAEVAAFVQIVGARAEVIPLVETAAAAERISEIASIPGLREIMVGLNDLHLSLALANPFEIVVSARMQRMARCVQGAGMRFGFGGLARVDDRALPIAPDLIFAQYPRLGASSAWLSRSFFRGIGPCQVGPAVHALRERLRYWATQPLSALARERDRLAAAIDAAATPASRALVSRP
ncbi:MAG: aldolase/citrate lyase family protein [Bryobacteraceae bacterium]